MYYGCTVVCDEDENGKAIGKRKIDLLYENDNRAVILPVAVFGYGGAYGALGTS